MKIIIVQKNIFKISYKNKELKNTFKYRKN